ncbi:DUF4113 domain-containing protein [Kiloniella majae]
MRFAKFGVDADWKMRQRMVSPKYTIRLG